MRKPVITLLAMLVGTVGMIAPTWSVPLEAYGRLPDLEDVAISPSGERLAFVTTKADERLIVVHSLADHTTVAGLRVGNQKLRGISWADDNHLMVTTSVTTLPLGFVGMNYEWYLLQVYDLRTHKSRPVPDPDSVRLRTDTRLMNVISGPTMVRSVNGHTLLFVSGVYVTDRALRALFRVDLDTGEQSLTRFGSKSTQGWFVGMDGEVTAQEDYYDEEQRWALKIRRDGSLKEVASMHAGIDLPEVLGFGPDGDTLLTQSIEEGNPVWKLLSLRDGTFQPPMAERKVFDGPIEDPRTRRLIGGVQVEDFASYVFFDPRLQHRWDAILRAFPGDHLRLVSASDDFKKIVVRVDGPGHGLAFELIDMDTYQATLVGAVYEGVTRPLEVRRITYSAADGLTVPAYLTLPAGPAAKGLPLVVLPHGGPAVRDTADFNWWAQALADQGYAVLQPNYRGSALGRPYLEAGFGQWGRKMQTDLSDGVRYLVKEGIVDPARVCIVGGSYGGYAALAGVTLDPGVYRCAVSIAGVSDLKRMLEWVNAKHRSEGRLEQRYWDRFMGASGPRDPALEAISPIKHIDAVSVPVLLIHGRDDTVVPFEQSTLMYDALRRAKKDVELVALKHEDHWLSRSDTRLQMLQTSITFLRTHNPAN
jgi:dipeptidyl aminopeptidase/acylaminoacyl peptidase